MSPAGQGDDRATFLAEFRALRDRAALDYEELAARAHFPIEVLKGAESGPGLPGLPILAAYVRACGGDVTEWEERWRWLASSADEDAGLPVRPAGASPAAVAGARAGVTVVPAEAHDPERIKAALRALREREEQADHGGLSSPDPGWPSGAADSRNVPAGRATLLANGNHHKKPRPGGLGGSLTQSATAWAPAPSVPPASASAPTSAPAPAPASAEPETGARVSASQRREAARDVTTFAPRSTAAGPRADAEASPSFAAEPRPSKSPAPASAEQSQTGPGRRKTASSSHPGLLFLLVVAVLIGCVALLAFT